MPKLSTRPCRPTRGVSSVIVRLISSTPFYPGVQPLAYFVILNFLWPWKTLKSQTPNSLVNTMLTLSIGSLNSFFSSLNDLTLLPIYVSSSLFSLPFLFASRIWSPDKLKSVVFLGNCAVMEASSIPVSYIAMSTGRSERRSVLSSS